LFRKIGEWSSWVAIPGKKTMGLLASKRSNSQIARRSIGIGQTASSLDKKKGGSTKDGARPLQTMKD